MASFWDRVTVTCQDVVVKGQGISRVEKQIAWVNYSPLCFYLPKIDIDNVHFEQRCQKMLKQAVLEQMAMESPDKHGTDTKKSLEESWSKEDEEALLASLAESDVQVIKWIWQAGSDVIGAVQKLVDTRLVDPEHRFHMDNLPKSIQTHACLDWNDKAAVDEMCAAFVDIFGARSKEVVEWARTSALGDEAAGHLAVSKQIGNGRASMEFLKAYGSVDLKQYL